MSVSAIVIEQRFLVREALISLLVSKGYRAIGKDSAADAVNSCHSEHPPRLVILGPRPADEVQSVVHSMRQLWKGAKIVLLFDQESSTNFNTLLESEIDGCFPLCASPDQLVDTLERVISTQDLKILVLKTAKQERCNVLGLAPLAPMPSDVATIDSLDRTSSVRNSFGLSKRQEEILVGLTKGHSNKMIARTCGITEATIKVHMKAVLLRIKVLNRTQAAVWALGKGYGSAAQGPSSAIRMHEAVAA